MPKIYFEEKGEELLKKLGMPKTVFAQKMGIKKQNVKVLFKSKNLETIRRAAEVMGVPFEFLIGYTEEPSIEYLESLPITSESLAPAIQWARRQRSKEIARAMLAKNIDDATIMDLTGLTEDEVAALKD